VGPKNLRKHGLLRKKHNPAGIPKFKVTQIGLVTCTFQKTFCKSLTRLLLVMVKAMVVMVMMVVGGDATVDGPKKNYRRLPSKIPGPNFQFCTKL